MSNPNVSDSNFDKTFYCYDAHVKIDNTGKYSAIVDPLSTDVVHVGKELALPKGKHLVRLTVTAQVLSSQLQPEVEEPREDDLAQDYFAEKAAEVFYASNAKVPVTNGVHDLF